MKVFIYYKTATDECLEDVAIVRAKSEYDARKLFSKYYTIISDEAIKEIIMEGDNLPEIEFISKYTDDAKLQKNRKFLETKKIKE